MNGLDDYVKNKKAMGQRFKQFRELIGKSKQELADEAEEALIMDERINLFEKGAILPDIILYPILYRRIRPQPHLAGKRHRQTLL
jgi:DNA-binding XRE family transcriptional regulator